MNSFLSYSQEASLTDSVSNKFSLKPYIFPATLAISATFLTNSKFEKQFQWDVRSMLRKNFETELDDHLQHIPVYQMYIADLAGIKARNHWFNQSKYLFISQFLSSSITEILKKTTNKTRPSGSAHAFPSGHTSWAFTNAAVLQKEFQYTSPWLAYSGYSFSTATGALRIANNVHWLSDVVFSAGLSIIIVELVYYFEPFKDFNPFIKSKGVTLLPKINSNEIACYLSFALN